MTFFAADYHQLNSQIESIRRFLHFWNYSGDDEVSDRRGGSFLSSKWSKDAEKELYLVKNLRTHRPCMASWIAGVARALKGSKGEGHVCSICNASFEDKAELEIHTGKEHQGRGT
jgi:hypothetical protein